MRTLLVILSLLFACDGWAQYLAHRRAAWRSAPSAEFTYYGTLIQSAAGPVGGGLERGGALTDLSDSGIGLFSCWMYLTNTTGTYPIYKHYDGATTYLEVYFDGRIRIYGWNSGGTQVMRLYTATGVIPANTWTHILAGWDLSTAGRYAILTNGVNAGAATLTFTTGQTIKLSSPGVRVKDGNAANSYASRGFSEVYFTAPSSYYDLTVSANVAKFISGAKPVDLGSDGSTPTGSQPAVYLHGNYSAFNVNSGFGGNFTSYGTFTDMTPP